MKRSELREMIKQAMLGEDARTDAEQEGYEDGFKDAKDDIKDKLKDMKVSEADLDENAIKASTGEVEQSMVDNLVKTMAEKYGYSEQDAVYAIISALNTLKKNLGMPYTMDYNPDSIDEEMDVPMDRLNFYARTMVKANLRDLGVDLKDPMSTSNDIYIDGVDNIAAMLRDGRDMEAEQEAGFIASEIDKLMEKNKYLKEDEKEEDEEIESEEEISVEDELEVEATPEVSGDTAEVQDHLEAALEAAIAMGDDKLATQIKNTQIYLTRSQTVSEEDTVEEDLYENRRMLKIAGIIK